MLRKLKKIPCFYCLFMLFSLFIYINTYIYFTYPKNVLIAVGGKNGAYYAYALRYQQLLKKYGINLNITQTAGSTEAQMRLNSDEQVTFAFAQGGTEYVENSKGIHALANVAHEPIWVFYRDENITSFRDLVGKKINICNRNSGTNPVARKMLVKLLDIDESLLSEEKATEAFEQLRQGKIDAMFYIIGRSSSSLQNMIKDESVHIMDFSDFNAIKKVFIENDMNISLNSYFKSVVLPKYSLFYGNKIPKKDTTLLVKRTKLVTKGASEPMIRLMLKVAEEVHSKEAFFHEEGHFLNTYGFRFPQHCASKAYFENKEHHYEMSVLINNKWIPKSYWVAQSLNALESTVLILIIPLGLIGFFIEVMYPLIKIYTRRKINRWYRRMNKLDTSLELLNSNQLKEKKEELQKILMEIKNTDNIDAVHLEAYYSLQLQSGQMLEIFERRIKEKRLKRLKRLKFLKKFKRTHKVTFCK